MAVVFEVIAYELALLLLQFLFGNSYLLFPVSPGCCGDALVYQRLARLSCTLLLIILAAAAILLSVAMARSSARTYKGVAWKLRALLLLGIALSAASTFVAFPTYNTGYGHHSGCIKSTEPVVVALMVIMELLHGGAALRVAMALD
ncbi:unnamed protein product [Alopecurus aequalis]